MADCLFFFLTSFHFLLCHCTLYSFSLFPSFLYKFPVVSLRSFRFVSLIYLPLFLFMLRLVDAITALSRTTTFVRICARHPLRMRGSPPQSPFVRCNIYFFFHNIYAFSCLSLSQQYLCQRRILRYMRPSTAACPAWGYGDKGIEIVKGEEKNTLCWAD